MLGKWAIVQLDYIVLQVPYDKMEYIWLQDRIIQHIKPESVHFYPTFIWSSLVEGYS